MLMIIALIATDLPLPVAPAISRCGMRARSPTTGWPAVSLPSASVSVDGELRERLRFEHLAQHDLVAPRVGDLDADHRLARHRRQDAHAGHAQRHGQIVAAG